MSRIEQSQADGHRDQGHRDGGQQFEDQRGQEGQLEGGQRGRPVAVGDLCDGPGLGLGPAEDLQGGQARHHVEEVPGQALEGPHAGSRAVPRGQTHQAHEHRDQRHGHRDEGGRDPVGAGHHDDDGHRDDDGQEELGQVAREVAVERVDAGRDEHGEPPAVLLLESGRAQGGDVLGRRVPQLRLGGGRGPVGGPLGRPGQDGTPDDDRQQEEERVAQRGQRPVVEEGTVDHSGDEPGLRDDQECRQAADDDGQDDEAPGCARVAQEPGVEGPAGRRPGSAGTVASGAAWATALLSCLSPGRARVLSRRGCILTPPF